MIPALQAMVEDQLTLDECIHGWSQTPTDDIVVFIINKELAAAHEIALRKMGQPVRSGRSLTPWREISQIVGHGRTLVFAWKNGQWRSVGLGSWGHGLSDLRRYFEMMAQDDPNPQWQHGLEMCQLWFMLNTEKVTQDVIDSILARLDAEPNPGPVWLDLRAQLARWASAGLSSGWPPKG